MGHLTDGNCKGIPINSMMLKRLLQRIVTTPVPTTQTAKVRLKQVLQKDRKVVVTPKKGKK